MTTTDHLKRQTIFFINNGFLRKCETWHNGYLVQKMDSCCIFQYQCVTSESSGIIEYQLIRKYINIHNSFAERTGIETNYENKKITFKLDGKEVSKEQYIRFKNNIVSQYSQYTFLLKDICNIVFLYLYLE